MWIEIDPTRLYEIAKEVAQSTDEPAEVIVFLQNSFKGLFVEEKSGN